MSCTEHVEYPYEASDEASENELLDRSLSMWRGWGSLNTDTDGFDPIPIDLHTASSIGQYDTVRAIVQSGKQDLDKKNHGSWTPLMYACYIGHDNIVNLLLDAGVDVNLKSAKGQTPLILAASCGNESVAYFLLQQGADLTGKDRRGWSALFHATNAGHQNMVKFLLEEGADTESREPTLGLTPLCLAAGEGHEIIVQTLLDHGANVNSQSYNGDTPRMLALINGHSKIVGLIDTFTAQPGTSLRAAPGLGETNDDLSSSDEFKGHRKPPPRSHHHRSSRARRTPSIRDGPAEFARKTGIPVQPQQKGNSKVSQPHPPSNDPPPQNPAVPNSPGVPSGYVTFQDEWAGEREEGEICFRDVISPINVSEHDLDSSGGRVEVCLLVCLCEICFHTGISPHQLNNPNHKTALLQAADPANTLDEQCAFALSNAADPANTLDEQCAFALSNALTIKSSSSSSGDLEKALGLNQEQQPTQPELFSQAYQQQPQAPPPMPDPPLEVLPPLPANITTPAPDSEGSTEVYQPPKNLLELLNNIQCAKYLPVFEDQDIDLHVFLTLTDNDLKEIGIKLMGPRRKMTSAIARYHSHARLHMTGPEHAYADKLESEMQEMAMQLHRVYAQAEQLKEQVLQERELRGVVEGCLMEDKAAWHRVRQVATETRELCSDVRLLVHQVRMCQDEFSRKLLLTTAPPPSGCHGVATETRELCSDVRLLVHQVRMCQDEFSRKLLPEADSAQPPDDRYIHPGPAGTGQPANNDNRFPEDEPSQEDGGDPDTDGHPAPLLPRVTLISSGQLREMGPSELQKTMGEFMGQMDVVVGKAMGSIEELLGPHQLSGSPGSSGSSKSG
ncbi:ankyrin repeat and SAM domain-containing protein 3-like [Branchiostoma lanceolatum]|uniref:ankyrin repeat and SAM domain-containing protein 3-like n=1 Tax=Branchiostoma lanceolatum TaxID=7740 RepID=UPI003457215C